MTRGQILLGKLIPCLLLSLFQGFFLLLAGKLIFGMSWGPEAVWLIPLVFTTSIAAMGMAMLIAGTLRHGNPSRRIRDVVGTGIGRN